MVGPPKRPWLDDNALGRFVCETILATPSAWTADDVAAACARVYLIRQGFHRERPSAWTQGLEQVVETVKEDVSAGRLRRTDLRPPKIEKTLTDAAIRAIDDIVEGVLSRGILDKTLHELNEELAGLRGVRAQLQAASDGGRSEPGTAIVLLRDVESPSPTGERHGTRSPSVAPTREHLRQAIELLLSYPKPEVQGWAFLTLAQVAYLFDAGRSTVERWVKGKNRDVTRLVTSRKKGRTGRVFVATLMEWAEENREKLGHEIDSERLPEEFKTEVQRLVKEFEDRPPTQQSVAERASIRSGQRRRSKRRPVDS